MFLSTVLTQVCACVCFDICVRVFTLTCVCVWYLCSFAVMGAHRPNRANQLRTLRTPISTQLKAIQEVLRAPLLLNGLACMRSLECLGDTVQPPVEDTQLQPRGSRYDAQLAVLGADAHTALAGSRIFVVRAGSGHPDYDSYFIALIR